MSDQVMIALPTGRTRGPVLELLRDAGVRLNLGNDERCLLPTGAPDGFRFCVPRPEDAAEMIRRGVIDAAFIGDDLVEEFDLANQSTKLLDTGLTPVKLCSAARLEAMSNVRQALESREPLRIATKYEKCTQNWARSKKVAVEEILKVGGSCEMYPFLGYDLIVDVVDSGQTLAANSLGIIEVIRTSTTCLYGKPECRHLRDLVTTLESVLRARERVLLDLNVRADRKEAVVDILTSEALNSVNVLPAADGSCSMRIAVKRSRVFDVLRRARAAGATGEVITEILSLGSGA